MNITHYKELYPDSFELNPKTSADIMIEQEDVSKATTFDDLMYNSFKKIENISTSAELTLLPNKVYDFENLQSNTILLNNVSGDTNEYQILFSTNDTPPVITWPIDLKWQYGVQPIFKQYKKYIINIVDNNAIYQEFSYTLVDTLPLDGSSSPLVLLSTDGKVYLWGKVIELNGPDTFTFPAVLSDLKSASWEIMYSIRDVIAGSASSFQPIFQCKGATAILHWEVSSSGRPSFAFRNAGEVVFRQIDIPVNILDGRFHKLKVAFNSTTKIATACIDSSNCTTVDLTEWAPSVDASASIIKDYTVNVRPLQVCCIQQSLNGTLIDHLPCDDGAGTAVRNIVTPARAGSLSDPLAWGRGWRAIT